ncbi:hypothetical protein [Deinococcus aquaticus]|uniref:hypothetical protein n=1 Tax=Deinococcus aquaticus TaxID=328692 RepID=UPI003F451A64
MTTYLDDSWLEEEQRQFEHLKQQLLASARLLDQAVTGVPELTRQLQQLAQREREMQRTLDRLSREQQQNIDIQTSAVLEGIAGRSAEGVQAIGARLDGARTELDVHFRQIVGELDRSSHAGSLLNLQSDVQTLVRNVSSIGSALEQVQEQSAAHAAAQRNLTSQAERLDSGVQELSGLTGTYPERWAHETTAMIAPLRTQLTELTGALQRHETAVGTLHEQCRQYERRLQQDQAALGELGAALRSGQTDLQGLRQLVQTWNDEQKRHGSTLLDVGKRIEQLEPLTELLRLQGEAQEQLFRRSDALEQDLTERLSTLERKMRGMIEAGIGRVRDEQEAQIAKMGRELAALREADEVNTAQWNTKVTLLERRLGIAEQRNLKLESRVEAQQELMNSFERSAQVDSNRISRFVKWFSEAGPVARLRGKPE